MDIARSSTVKIGVLMDPIDGLKKEKDTSLALIEAALEKGWEVYYFEQSSMRLDENQVFARLAKLTLSLDQTDWYQLDDMADRPLTDLNAVLMRVDPPFNMDYIYSTYLLEHAERQGVLIVNKPSSLRDCNEKLFATQFPQCCPPLLVTSDQSALRAFHKKHQDVIYKPLDGMGGSAIFRAAKNEHNLSVILETLTDHGAHPIWRKPIYRRSSTVTNVFWWLMASRFLIVWRASQRLAKHGEISQRAAVVKFALLRIEIVGLLSR